MSNSNHFPDFDYPIEQLSKFIATSEMVTIMLKNGNIIHYSPKDIFAFLRWLHNHGIEDLKKSNKQ